MASELSGSPITGSAPNDDIVDAWALERIMAGERDMDPHRDVFRRSEGVAAHERVLSEEDRGQSFAVRVRTVPAVMQAAGAQRERIEERVAPHVREGVDEIKRPEVAFDLEPCPLSGDRRREAEL